MEEVGRAESVQDLPQFRGRGAVHNKPRTVYKVAKRLLNTLPNVRKCATPAAESVYRSYT